MKRRKSGDMTSSSMRSVSKANVGWKHTRRRLIVSHAVESFPQGFPRLASLVSCDDSLAMHRGFKRLHNRLLLQLEAEITELEKDLDKLDKEDAEAATNYRLMSTKHEEDWDASQVQLFDKIKSKLKEYGQYCSEIVSAL